MIFSATLPSYSIHPMPIREKIKYSGGRNVMLQDLRYQTLVKNSHRSTVCELSRTSRVSVSPCCALVTVAVSCVIIGRHMGCQSYCMSVTGIIEETASYAYGNVEQFFFLERTFSWRLLDELLRVGNSRSFMCDHRAAYGMPELLYVCNWE